MISPLAILPVPSDRTMLARLGGGDPDRTKTIMLALYAYLADKPSNTQRAYRTSLRQFFDMVQWRAPETITVAEAVRFKRYLQEQGKADSTICVRLAAVDGFFEFLCQPHDTTGKAFLASNPFVRVTRKDVTPTPFGRSVPVEPMDFEKMLAALPSTPVGMRDSAVLIFLAYTGRRRAEVANLRIRDLSVKSRPRTYVCRVKGGEEATFELPDIAYDAIRAHWISADRLKHLKPDSGVFGPVGQTPFSALRDLDAQRPLCANSIAAIVKQAAARAGVDWTRTKVHGLRHMAARNLDRAGVPLQRIQQFLRHKQPNTTAVYLGQLRGPGPSMEAELKAVMEKARREAMEAAG